MGDYRVNLDVFAGPLDLLLYLIRKDEVDIYDIHIARITEQYLRYIEMFKSLDIDLAGDFLVMAATLMQIKSAMLLPQVPGEFDDEDLTDPRTELIRQLLEYKKFKDAANLLSDAVEEQKSRFSRPDTILEKLKPQGAPAVDIDQISVWDLLEAFDSILEATGSAVDMSHIADETPIDLYQIEILHRLQTEGRLGFEQIFESRGNRLVLIGLFLALLELIRESLIAARQSSSTSVVYIEALTDEPAEQAVQKAIITYSEETEDEQEPPDQQAERPPIEISELPAKDKSQKTDSVTEVTSRVENASQRAEQHREVK